jgi:hypothetical protein
MQASSLLTFKKLRQPKTVHESPLDIEMAATRKPTKSVSPAGEKGSKHMQANSCEISTSDEQLSVVARREALTAIIIPDPPAFDLTMLKRMSGALR